MSGNLIEAFQQGWSFVDNLERQQKDDAFKDEMRGRQRKEWQEDDETKAEHKANYEKYFGEKKDEPAKPATPQGPDIAAKGIPLEPTAPAATEHSTQATPTDGQLVPAGADSGMGPKITAWGGKPAPTLAEITAPKSTAEAGRGYINPPNAVPAPAPGNSTAGAGRGMVNPAPVDPGYQSTAGAGRGVVNPPVVTAADRSVAPGKVDLNNMNPTETQRLMDLAKKQFGPALRFAKAGPSDAAAPAEAAAPSGAQVAASNPVAVSTNPSMIDKRNNINHLLDFALDSAKIDIKRGKAGGEGLATLIKTVQTVKDQGLDRAIALMDQGMFQEGQDAYNNAGGHTMRIISKQDSFIKVGKQQLPTTIVTMQAEDGSIRTVNTKQFLMQGMKAAEQLDAILKGEQIEATKEHYAGMREDRKADNADRSAARADAAADRAERNQIARERVQVSKEDAEERRLARAERAPVGPKLPESVKQSYAGLQKRYELYETQRAKTLAEGGDPSKLDKDLAAISIQMDTLLQPHLPEVNRTPPPTPTKPGETAKATSGAAQAAKGVEAKPAAKAEPKPAAPAYVPPADSVAGQTVARRQAELAAKQSGDQAKESGKKQTQSAFTADAGKLSPKELVSKYDGKQGDLTPEQAAALFKAKNQPAR